MTRAAYVKELPDSTLRCELCPHGCTLRPGDRGLCRVRVNREGRMELPALGLLSSLAVDPIEKKPLYRFMPGSRVFSVGFYGCNLRCPHCQNWQISQVEAGAGRPTEPAALVELALASGAPSLAFTYSEPLVHYEYLLEAASLARAGGLRTVLVTNGNLSPAPAARLLPLFDAVNLDIKCFSASAYRRSLAGDLETTLAFARTAAATSWLEVTTLVVPGLDEWESAVEGISAFLAALSPKFPLHLTAYHPAYKSRMDPTSPSLLHSLCLRAGRVLHHVYEGNLAGLEEEERCGACGDLLFSRRGYEIGPVNMVPRQGRRAFAPGAGGYFDEPLAACGSCGHPEFFLLQAETRGGP